MFMRRMIIAALLSLAGLRGQGAPARPAFELASIKPDNILQTSFDIVPRRSGNRITMHNTQLAMVIAYAYRVANPSWEVTGSVRLPDGWNFYDIEAVVGGDGSGAVSDDELRLMFQTLLSERFKLKVHRETREMTAYELVVAKGGAKLKAADPDGEVTLDGQPIEQGNSFSAYGADGGTHLLGRSASMERLVYALSGRLRAPVVDRTGLTGLFDYNVVFSREDVPSDAGGPPALATALQEEMGLRLEKGRSQVEIIVVDHVEKPSAN
jgi:uncharacterized protein (TIGR03435 family)